MFIKDYSLYRKESMPDSSEINLRKKVPWGRNLYRLEAIGDGSCYYHSLLTCIHPEYLTKDRAGKQVICQELRNHIARSLTIADFLAVGSSGVPLHKDLPPDIEKYESDNYTLPANEIEMITKELDTMHNRLEPVSDELYLFLRKYLAFRNYLKNLAQDVGDEVHLLTSRVLNIDIYVTTEGPGPGYMLNDPAVCFRGRESVILYNTGRNHWEPVVQVEKGGVTTLFHPRCTLVLQLRAYNVECWQKLQKG